MEKNQPSRRRVYLNHHLDSTRWDHYKPRDNDIIISTSYKSGTTWAQHILFELIHSSSKEEVSFGLANPWIDKRFDHKPIDQLMNEMNEFKFQRVIKTHLPLDALPYFDQVNYIVIARDCRDVFMSWYNHYSSYTDHAYQLLNLNAEIKLPPCPSDINEAWRNWIGKGLFDWESEGYPWWGNLNHTNSYWEFKHLSNIHFFHYQDMKDEPEKSILSMAEIAGHSISSQRAKQIQDRCEFETLKKRMIEKDKNHTGPLFFKDSSKSFFHKGLNGRWRDVLSNEDLELYHDKKKQVLAPECIKWLENGGEVLK